MSEQKWRKQFMKRLKARMKALDINQTELAKMTAIDSSEICRYLKGEHAAIAYNAVKLANALAMNVSDLIGF